MRRSLAALSCPSGPAVLSTWWQPLAAALDGSGPAVLPVPPRPQRDPVLSMARLEEPVADDVALVVPTSGSTGAPKGAVLSAAALQHSARATLEALGGDGRWLLALPVTHIAGQQVLVRSLLAGVEPLCLDLSAGFEPEAFAAATAGMGATRRYTALVPTQLARLLDSPARAALTAYDAVLVGGAAAAPTLLHRARVAGVRVVTTYGMSETAGGCVYDGVPLDGVQVRLDADGRIRLGGSMVFSGYRLRPDLTAAALEVDGVRWHVTNDLGHWSGSRLEVLGRRDDVIVTGGEKVAPLPVEAALVALPEVRAAAVVGVADEQWGQRVVAAVVPTQVLSPPTLDGIRAALTDLPRHALPREVVVVDTLPLLPSGKTDRDALRALVSRP